jgi:serine/threonine protein phosphatase 1
MNTPQKIFAIGDPHGCYKSMMALIDKLPIDKENDILVFLGDYIDRGPRSKQIISQLMKWNRIYPKWQFLFGNHEDLMLDALVYNGRQYHSYDLWWMQGGKETTKSYVPKNRSTYERALSSPKDVIPYSHLKWLMERPYYYETEEYFFVHAGVIPNMSLGKLKRKLDFPLPNDEKQNAIWIRDQFIDSDCDWGKKIIFGHTTDGLGQYYNPANKWGKNQKFMPIVKKNKIGIDCAVCPSACERICALELPSETFYFQEFVD